MRPAPHAPHAPHGAGACPRPAPHAPHGAGACPRPHDGAGACPRPAPHGAGACPRPEPRYRADIDGLRAVAVIAVVAYHAFPDVAPGGFAGVDVFFVISGYLITGIIRSSSTFSFADFYARRVRRLFPALLVTLLLSLAAGAFFLLEHELTQLGEHVLAATLYISNFTLFQESGYFDTDAGLKPLQHLWSLAVEEQFYLLWPVLLVVGARRLRLVIGAVIALSFAVNVALVIENPSAAFYLPFSRLWELALGGAVAVLGLRLHPRLALLGVVMIGASFVVVDSAGFPGLQALLPTLGAALVMAARPSGFLASRYAVYIGKISYSLYLFHWPLLVFPRIISGDELSLSARVAAVLATFALAALSTRFIENPLRHGGRRVVIGLLLVAVALGVLGKLVALKVLHGRHDDAALAPIQQALGDWSYMSGAASFTRGAETFFRKRGTQAGTVLFVGDSFMEQYWPGVDDVMQRLHTRSVIFATKHACPPFARVVFDKHRECAPYVSEMRALARDEGVDVVVISAVWTHYWAHPRAYDGATREQAFDELERWMTELARTKRVVLLLASPQGTEFDPKRMLRLTGPTPAPVARAVIDAQVEPANARLRAAAARAGAEVIDPVEFLCDSVECPVMSPTGQPFMNDGSHLRPFAVRERMTFIARLLAPM